VPRGGTLPAAACSSAGAARTPHNTSTCCLTAFKYRVLLAEQRSAEAQHAGRLPPLRNRPQVIALLAALRTPARSHAAFRRARSGASPPYGSAARAEAPPRVPPRGASPPPAPPPVTSQRGDVSPARLGGVGRRKRREAAWDRRAVRRRLRRG